MERVHLQSNFLCASSHTWQLYYTDTLRWNVTFAYSRRRQFICDIRATVVIIGSERKPPEWVHKIKIKRAAVLEKRDMCSENRVFLAL